MRTVIALIVCSVLSSPVFAAGSCVALREEFLAMKRAQSKILNGLVKNHGIIADSFEEYADLIGKPHQVDSGATKKILSIKMKNSAHAVRIRGKQGRKLVLKLNLATDDLLRKLDACLK
jgi:hypothetical protein